MEGKVNEFKNEMLELSNLTVDHVLGLCKVEVVVQGYRPLVWLIPGFDKDGAYRFVRLCEDDQWTSEY